MGTNYYFFSKNKELMNKNFPSHLFKSGRRDEGYSLVDEPEFGYEVHICKLSFGWLPLFEHHSRAFTNFDELEAFYRANEDDLRIFDEYYEEFTWEKFKDIIITHSQRKEEPVKWVYEENPVFKIMGDCRKSLFVKPCGESEDVDMMMPFRHDEYFRTEDEARKKFGLWDYAWNNEGIVNEYYRDPNEEYKIDWAYGTFS